MSMDISEFHEVFYEECAEHLNDMEQCLLYVQPDNVDTETVNTLFRAAHSIKGGSGMFGFSAITGLTHVMETLLDKARNGSLELTTAILDTLLLSVDQLRYVLAAYKNGENVAVNSVEETIAAITHFIPEESLVKLQPETPESPSSESIDVEEFSLFAPLPEEPEKTVTASDDEQAAAKRVKPEPVKVVTGSTIRVDTQKIDSVMNQLGELVITQSVLRNISQQTQGQIAYDFEQALDTLNLQLRELQENALSMRMLPISSLFSRFNRLVRDVSKISNKDVNLILRGVETEIDKTMIEQLADPLTHLIRNAIDHGIETPEHRIKQGKNAKGSITLSAFQQGSTVVIELQDDGAGLHREKIINRAQNNGMNVSTLMSDEAVWKLIFEPGFTTSDEVSDLSGRGVGMDVVKSNIEALNGSIDIRSTLGEGTTFSLILPLTLAILDGMTVSVGKDIYIIPLLNIVESFQPKAEQIKKLGNQPVILNREHYWPILSLASCMGHTSQERNLSDGIIVLLNAATARVALLVDGLEGEQQIVIKSLKKHYRAVPNVSAATILGDGSVSLILDVEQLAKQVSLPTDLQKEKYDH